MGGDDILEGEKLLNQSNIPTYAYPDEAARAFDYMWHYSYNMRSLYETPSLAEVDNGSGQIGQLQKPSLIKLAKLDAQSSPRPSQKICLPPITSRPLQLDRQSTRTSY